MVEQTSPVESPAAAPGIDPAIQTELAQQMAISLNGGIPPAAATESAPTGSTTETIVVATPSDPFGIFKEKFGYESPEAAVQEIETLRAFRAAPPAAELKFENEQSKLVVEALQAGKFDEVHAILDQQMKIDRLMAAEMNADTAAEIIKLGMQVKYKDQDLTPAEINYKFNKQYAMPAKPALLAGEDQDEYNERVAAWQAVIDDKKMELMIEAKLVKPELINTKSKLVFPSIARPQDAEFQEWQKSVQEDKRQSGETVQAYKAFTPKSLEMKLNFKDERNKIDFDYTHEPDPQSFTKAIEMVSDVNLFWNNFIGSDGTPNRKEFLEAVYFGLNRDKIIMDAMNQAKNATIKSSLPDNSTGGLVRQMPQTQEEENYVDKMMRISLKGHAGF